LATAETGKSGFGQSLASYPAVTTELKMTIGQSPAYMSVITRIKYRLVKRLKIAHPAYYD